MILDSAPRGEIEVRVLRSPEEIEEIRSAWTSWLGHRDSDIDFYLTVVASHPGTIRPHVIAAFQDGRPHAILIGRIDHSHLPLSLGYWRLPSPKLRIMTFVSGAQRGDTSAEVAGVLLQEVINSLNRGEADVGRFTFQPVDSDLFRLAWNSSGLFGRDCFSVPEPHWRLTLPTDFEELLQRVTGTVRKHFRSASKKLNGAFHDVVVKKYESEAELETMIRDVERVAAGSYQRGIGVGFQDDRETRQRLLYQVREGWLRAHVLYLDKIPAAFWVGSLYDGVYYSDYLSYHSEYGKHSPGTILQLHVFQQLCFNGIRCVDFGPGDARYKRQFGASMQAQATLYIYPTTIKGILLNLTRSLVTVTNAAAKAVSARLGMLQKLKKTLRRPLDEKSS